MFPAFCLYSFNSFFFFSSITSSPTNLPPHQQHYHWSFTLFKGGRPQCYWCTASKNWNRDWQTEVKEYSWLKNWVINTKRRITSHCIASKIQLWQYKCCSLSCVLRSCAGCSNTDMLFISRMFWSWACRRNFRKCKTFILWLKRKELHHLMRQKMNWAGRRRNWCLEQRSKGLLYAVNIATHCPSLRGAAGIFVAFWKCEPEAWYINALYCSSRLSGTFWTPFPLKLAERRKKLLV